MDKFYGFEDMEGAEKTQGDDTPSPCLSLLALVYSDTSEIKSSNNCICLIIVLFLYGYMFHL